MPTRSEILYTLAALQEQVIAIYSPVTTFMYSKVESIHGFQLACGLCASAG
jgi:hypothetical protein